MKYLSLIERAAAEVISDTHAEIKVDYKTKRQTMFSKIEEKLILEVIIMIDDNVLYKRWAEHLVDKGNPVDEYEKLLFEHVLSDIMSFGIKFLLKEHKSVKSLI